VSSFSPALDDPPPELPPVVTAVGLMVPELAAVVEEENDREELRDPPLLVKM
jgi:hypothetical protein